MRAVLGGESLAAAIATVPADRAAACRGALIHIAGLTVTGMRLIPQTTSVWASGTGVPVPGGQGDTVGVMHKYGP